MCKLSEVTVIKENLEFFNQNGIHAKYRHLSSVFLVSQYGNTNHHALLTKLMELKVNFHL